MKKSDKPILIKAFDDFTEKNNYHLDTTSWAMLYHFAPKSKQTDRTLDYQKEEFLFKTKMSQCANVERIYHFINFLFENEEYNPVAYRFMVEKTPIPESTNYYETMRKYIEILKDYPEKLYDYITRPAYLKVNLHNVQDLFDKHIVEQDKRETILEFYLNSENCQKFATKRMLYNLAQDYITEKDKYDDFFKDILVENKDKIKLIATQSQGEHYITKFNINDLVRFAPEKNEYEAKNCITQLASLTDYYDKLEVQSIKILEEKDNILQDGSTDGKTISVIWFAEKINVKLIESFTEKFVSQYLTIAGLSKLPEEAVKYGGFVNGCINETRAELLEEKISKIMKDLPSDKPAKRKL